MKKKFSKARETLETLKTIANTGKLNLVYVDESGFSGNLPVNSSWIKIGKEKCIEKINDRSIKVNSLGMFNYVKDDFSWATTQNTVDSDMFIGLFELAKSDYEVPTFFVLDNYSIHHSKKVKAKIKEWAKKKLFLYYLPPYSPELNLIESKWKNLKYYHIDKRYFNNRDELESAVNRGIIKMCTNP